MNPPSHPGRGPSQRAVEWAFPGGPHLVFVAWLLLAAVTIALAWPQGRTPGLYYDEAVHAGVAKDFVTGRPSRHYPGCEAIIVAGRPLPLFIQSYCGAVKGWMLVPPIAAWGSSLPVVRFASLAWGLLSLLVFMLWVERWQTPRLAILSGTLLAADPSWFFTTVIDWGPAVPGFLLRFLLFGSALAWQRRRSAGVAFMAGMCAGLGFFAKVDFVVIIVGAGLAAIAAVPGISAGIRGSPGSVFAAVAGFTAGALPMLGKVPGILASLASDDGRQAGGPPPTGEWAEKIDTIVSMYDGSYYHRIMESGGVFERMHHVRSAVWTPLGLIVAVALVVLAVMAGSRRLPSAGRRAARFVLAAAVLITVGDLLVPGAVRLHHASVVYPFPHLAVAMAALALWERVPDRFPASRSTGLSIRAAVAVGVVGLVVCDLLAVRLTQAALLASGGRGLWSNCLDAVCADIADRDDLTIVSLDWGFNENLVVLTDSPRLVEPIWQLAAGKELPAGLPTDPDVLYLLHAPAYAHFDFNAHFLDAALALPPGRATLRAHRDGLGEVVFHTLQFLQSGAESRPAGDPPRP